MKKLITILLLVFTFTMNAQVKRTFQPYESWAFENDKKKHVWFASGLSASIYAISYYKTREAKGSARVAILIPIPLMMGKELFDFIAGGEPSWADMCYGIGGSIVTSGLMYGGTKLLEGHKKRKQKRRRKKFEIDF